MPEKDRPATLRFKRKGRFKAKASSGCGSCVVLRGRNGVVFVEDSKDDGLYSDHKGQPCIQFDMRDWQRVTQTLLLAAGAASTSLVILERGLDGSACLQSTMSSTRLFYTRAEWDAFREGLQNGEFDLIPVAEETGEMAYASA